MKILTEKEICNGKVAYFLEVMKHPEHLDGGKSFWIQGNYAGYDRDDRDVWRVFSFLKKEKRWLVTDVILPEKSREEYDMHFTTTEVMNHDHFQLFVRGDIKGYIA